jgi:hypothetical protein
MTRPLKICAQCLASLRKSDEDQQDLASYLMGIGAGGVEIVTAGDCQAQFTRHDIIIPLPQTRRSLSDVTPAELDQAISLFLKQLGLPVGSGEDAYNLENAIKAEWLKALEMREYRETEAGDKPRF